MAFPLPWSFHLVPSTLIAGGLWENGAGRNLPVQLYRAGPHRVPGTRRVVAGQAAAPPESARTVANVTAVPGSHRSGRELQPRTAASLARDRVQAQRKGRP